MPAEISIDYRLYEVESSGSIQHVLHFWTPYEANPNYYMEATCDGERFHLNYLQIDNCAYYVGTLKPNQEPVTLSYINISSGPKRTYLTFEITKAKIQELYENMEIILPHPNGHGHVKRTSLVEDVFDE